MTDREKIEKSLSIIKKLGIEDVRHNAEETYQSLRDVGLFELAELITDMSNAIYDIRDNLEE